MHTVLVEKTQELCLFGFLGGQMERTHLLKYKHNKCFLTHTNNSEGVGFWSNLFKCCV